MSQDTLTRARIVVDGIVQGVGFRYKVQRMARNQRLTGYVKNLDDGTVEIVCEGAKSNIESFAEDIKMMEEPIVVERVDVSFEEPKKEFRTFKVAAGELTEETVEGFSTGSMYFEMMLGKQDETIREIRVTREELKGEVRGLREDLKTFIDDRLKKLEEDIASIKSKLGML